MNKHELFEALAKTGKAVTYADIRLATGYSDVDLADLDLSSRFSRNIGLECPIVSAPMDTVTEHKMAIALAKAGGLGIIHKNLSPEKQAKEVARVKYHLNAIIARPICIFGDEIIQSIHNRRQEKGYGFMSFPVIDSNGKLIGLLTKNDFDFCDDPQKFAKDIMTSELVTAPVGTRVSVAYEIMMREKKKVLPLINDSGEVEGMYIFSDAQRIMTGSQDIYNIEKRNNQLVVGAAIGTGDAELDRARLLLDENVDVLVIDTAHGDSKKVYDILEKLNEMPGRDKFDVVVGNVSSGASAKRLADNGVDGIKVGQGPGSICTTRNVAGIGCPQVTAIYNCVTAVEGMDVPICADGGITCSGDIVVALGVGADSVMLGRLFAGMDESPGEIEFINGIPHKVYRGMGSISAMKDHGGSRERYGQTAGGKDQLVPEGIEGAVPCQGPVAGVLHQYIEGIKRGMGYTGFHTVSDLQKNVELIHFSAAGTQESSPHNIPVIKETPKGGLGR